MGKEQAKKKIDDLANEHFEEFGDWMAASGFRAALQRVVDEYYGEHSYQPVVQADEQRSGKPSCLSNTPNAKLTGSGR